MSNAEAFNSAGKKLEKEGENLDKKAGLEQIPYNEPTAAAAGDKFQLAAFEFEEAAASFLSEGKREAAEAAFVKAARCWNSAARCWTMGRQPGSGFAFEQAASDFAAKAAINERGGEYCEAGKARQSAAAENFSAATEYLKQVDDYRSGASAQNDKLQQAIANGDAKGADDARNGLDQYQRAMSDFTAKAGNALNEASRELQTATDDNARCK
jgi:phage terminase large subunit-like protein